MVRGVDRYVSAAFSSRRFPLVLGGDCPIVLGCVRAARRHRGDIGLVHVDGHEDSYPPPLSPTGDWADSEFAFTLGISPFAWDAELLREQPLVDERHLVAIGPRDSADIARHGAESIRPHVLVLAPEEVHDDPRASATEALGRAGAAPGGFWLHLDWTCSPTKRCPP